MLGTEVQTTLMVMDALVPVILNEFVSTLMGLREVVAVIAEDSENPDEIHITTFAIEPTPEVRRTVYLVGAAGSWVARLRAHRDQVDVEHPRVGATAHLALLEHQRIGVDHDQRVAALGRPLVAGERQGVAADLREILPLVGVVPGVSGAGCSRPQRPPCASFERLTN